MLNFTWGQLLWDKVRLHLMHGEVFILSGFRFQSWPHYGVQLLLAIIRIVRETLMSSWPCTRWINTLNMYNVIVFALLLNFILLYYIFLVLKLGAIVMNQLYIVLLWISLILCSFVSVHHHHYHHYHHRLQHCHHWSFITFKSYRFTFAFKLIPLITIVY